ncbi:MAG: xanthine dehydrogenase family protein molybdopterin-binding subunit [Chloroflexota bacterium]
MGSSIKKYDGVDKVTGRATYPGDINRDEMLHATLLFSGKPHARMLSIDLAEAEAVEGVIMILTAKDVPINEHGLVIFDQPVIVGLGSDKQNSDVSLWEGDRVAMIVAETAEAAHVARDLIKIEWEELPVVTDPYEALADEVIFHPENGSNLLKSYKIRKGDIESGFAQSDVIIESRYDVPMQEHAYLQPEAGVGYIDEAGRVTIEVAGQWIHEDQHLVAHALNLPDDQVRIIYPAIGGAFGGREDMSVQIVLGLATLKLKAQGIDRPVRIIWTREESIVGHHKRHAMSVKTRWGAKRDGTLMAVETELLLDAGAYNCTSNKVLGNAHLTVSGPYRIPHASVDSRTVYTSNCPGGAFRGFGAPQGAFVAESQMNKLAEALEIDPLELRLKNILHDGDESVLQTPLPAGVSLEKVLLACAEAAGWGEISSEGLHPANGLPKTFASLPPATDVIKRGRGIALAFKNIGYSFGFPERCEAFIELHGDSQIEKVVIRHGGADVGQGAHTAFRQMAAEAVGVPLSMVKADFSDTATSGDSGSASASRLTWMAGNAIIGAADRAKALWDDEERPAIGHFRYTPPPTEMFDEKTGRSNPNFTYGYVAEAVDVSVDVETGHVFVENVICANDVGRAVNPNLIEGQIEGAVIQAHGYAVTENLQHKDGHLLNPRFSGYLIPGIMDVPTTVKSVIVEEPDPLGPWGIRGMAEMPLIPLAPAITGAVHAATGVWIDELPLVPYKVLEKLQASERELG